MCKHTSYYLALHTRNQNENNIYKADSPKKVADFKTPGIEIGLELECNCFIENNTFSRGSSNPQRDARVIKVLGQHPMSF